MIEAIIYAVLLLGQKDAPKLTFTTAPISGRWIACKKAVRTASGRERFIGCTYCNGKISEPRCRKVSAREAGQIVLQFRRQGKSRKVDK